jgi:hypothetical protein
MVLFPPALQPKPVTKLALLKLTVKVPAVQLPVPAWAILPQNATIAIANNIFFINFSTVLIQFYKKLISKRC